MIPLDTYGKILLVNIKIILNKKINLDFVRKASKIINKYNYSKFILFLYLFTLVFYIYL